MLSNRWDLNYFIVTKWHITKLTFAKKMYLFFSAFYIDKHYVKHTLKEK